MRRKKKRGLPVFFAVLVVLATLGVFVFFYMKIVSGGSEIESQEQDSDVFEDRGRVQTEINKLDWIVPMPLTINEFSRPGTRIRGVKGIVIHYIGNPGTTALQNRNFFENLAIHQTTSVSSNFIIDLDGTIVQCIPVDEIAYATGIRNEDTLSIEVCHPGDDGKFTDESYRSVVRLTAWLCERYELTEDDVMRHFDVTGKECPKYYVENQDAWEALLADIREELGG